MNWRTSLARHGKLFERSDAQRSAFLKGELLQDLIGSVQRDIGKELSQFIGRKIRSMLEPIAADSKHAVFRPFAGDQDFRNNFALGQFEFALC